MGLNYEKAYEQEAAGSGYSFGIEIRIAAPEGVTESVKSACYRAAKELERAIMRDFYANDKASQQRAIDEKRQLLSLFPGPIYVEEIPNGYCSQACCEHLPWFVVTTRVGRIQIGWRKRVISINWSETAVRKIVTADNVTKDDRTVHAWNLEDAAKYLRVLFSDDAPLVTTN